MSLIPCALPSSPFLFSKKMPAPIRPLHVSKNPRGVPFFRLCGLDVVVESKNVGVQGRRLDVFVALSQFTPHETKLADATKSLCSSFWDWFHTKVAPAAAPDELVSRRARAAHTLVRLMLWTQVPARPAKLEVTCTGRTVAQPVPSRIVLRFRIIFRTLHGVTVKFLKKCILGHLKNIFLSILPHIYYKEFPSMACFANV